MIKKIREITAMAAGKTMFLPAAFLFAWLSSCGSTPPPEGPISQAEPMAKTRVSLLGITDPVTLRVTITERGAAEPFVDEFHYFDEDAAASGGVPLSFNQDYVLEYADYDFEFNVYQCDCGEITSVDMLDGATLVGTAAEFLSVDDFEEDLPTVTISIGEGEDVTDALGSFPAEPFFNPETVYGPGGGADAGRYTSLDVDSAGNPHISFLYMPTSTTSRLAYTYNSDGAWEDPWLLSENNNGDSTVDDTGQYTSLALDSEDGVHIAYYDSTHPSTGGTSVQGCDPRYLSFSSGDVDFGASEKLYNGNCSSSKAGEYLSLSLYEKRDASRELQVYSYTTFLLRQSSFQRLFYAFNDTDDGSWLTGDINSLGRMGFYSKNTTDADGNIHMAYYNQLGSALGYAVCQSYAVTGGYEPCDPDHVVVSSAGVTATMSDAGGTVDQRVSIAVDNDRMAHILYYDYAAGDLILVYGSEDGWTFEVVADGTDLVGMGRYSDIAIDAYNNIHLVYYDADAENLKYKQGKAGDDWSSISPIEVDAGPGVGQFVSMKLDEARGLIHVAYYDATNQALKHAVSE